MPPSIEEIVLSKCKKPTKQEGEEFDRSPPNSPERWKRWIQKVSTRGGDCQAEETGKLRFAAWYRFTDQLVNRKCGRGDYDATEISILELFEAIPLQQRTDQKKKEVLPLLQKYDEFLQCYFGAKIDFLNEVTQRAHDASPGATPPADFQFDPADVGDPSALSAPLTVASAATLR